MPILIKRILLQAPKSWLSRLKYIHPFSDFYINLKTRLVETFLTLQKFLREFNHLNLEKKVVGLL